jgi:cysteine/O-acetylserine efflux protein
VKKGTIYGTPFYYERNSQRYVHSFETGISEGGRGFTPAIIYYKAVSGQMYDYMRTFGRSFSMNIPSFLIYCMMITFTPGPTNIVILSTVHHSGTKRAMQFTYGATIAFGLLLVISAILNTVLLTILPNILLVMKMLGSGYMLYLASQIYRMDTTKPTVNRSGTFLSGFLMQFLNPKVVLFTMTVIPSFILPHYISKPAVTAGVFVITVIGFMAFTTWVLFGTIFKKILLRYNKAVNVIMALFLAYSALILWI